jgi:hypothetical protein
MTNRKSINFHKILNYSVSKRPKSRLFKLVLVLSPQKNHKKIDTQIANPQSVTFAEGTQI